jgi:RNA polymerase sigma factor (sigma-70 family)
MQAELKQLLPALRRFAYSLTGSMADADDLLQNTVLRLLNAPPPEHVPLPQWAFKICRNLWIDDYRSQKVRQQAAQQVDLQQANFRDGEQDMLNEIQLSQVNSAMNTLPDEQREVLSLVAVQGLSYQEAANVLAIPAGTIMSRLARARAAMVSALQYHGGLA